MKTSPQCYIFGHKFYEDGWVGGLRGGIERRFTDHCTHCGIKRGEVYQLSESIMNEERPEFLNCVMTPEIIRDIRERQEAWDEEHKNER